MKYRIDQCGDMWCEGHIMTPGECVTHMNGMHAKIRDYERGIRTPEPKIGVAEQIVLEAIELEQPGFRADNHYPLDEVEQLKKEIKALPILNYKGLTGKLLEAQNENARLKEQIKEYEYKKEAYQRRAHHVLRAMELLSEMIGKV